MPKKKPNEFLRGVGIGCLGALLVAVVGFLLMLGWNGRQVRRGQALIAESRSHFPVATRDIEAIPGVTRAFFTEVGRGLGVTCHVEGVTTTSGAELEPYYNQIIAVLQKDVSNFAHYDEVDLTIFGPWSSHFPGMEQRCKVTFSPAHPEQKKVRVRNGV